MVRFRGSRRRGVLRPLLRLVLLLAIAALAGLVLPRWLGGDSFACPTPHVIDGDTLRCGGRTVRLEGIDAPEREGQCQPDRDCVPGDPHASAANLRKLAGRSILQCTRSGTDQHGRTVARCAAGDTDLSCAQIEGGYAVRRYATIICWP
jgi:endonuclease YncB( thermonuclease family)